jgi:hypothetical protein
MRLTRVLTAGIAIAFLAIFAVRADRTARSTSQTFDEAVHLTAGVSYWRTGDFRMNRETPPFLKLVWALPLVLGDAPPFRPDPDLWERNDIWRLGDAYLYDSGVAPDDLLLPARRVNIALGLALVAGIGWWAFRLWGRSAGILALALAAFDPNIAGQSAVLSTDIGLALFSTAAAYSLWEYARNSRRAWFVLAGMSLGLALTTKFSALAFVAASGLGAVYFVLTGGDFGVSVSIPPMNRRERLFQVVGAFVRLGLIAFAVIVIVYFGIHALDWSRGLKQQLIRGEFGDPHFYLNSEVSTTGWWHYFPEVLAIKTPPGTLLLFLTAAVGLLVQRPDRRATAFVFIPAAIYFLAMAISKIDIGWRVILPAYPALLLFAARTTMLAPRLLPKMSRAARVVVYIGFVAVMTPAVFDPLNGPRELSYTNNLIATRGTLYRYLGDSNLDWGQGLKSLKSELALRGDPVIYLSYAGTARPEAYGVHYERLPGWGQFQPPPADRVDPLGPIFVAVSVSDLQGIYLSDPTLYLWLLDRTPISRTDDSIWLWDLTGDADAIARLHAAMSQE